MSIIKISDCQKTYKGRKVLSMSRLELEYGLIYAVLGANGSGKSTFAKLAAGIEKPDNKDFCVNHVGGPGDPGADTPGPVKLQIGYMPQRNYAFRMSVRSNLLLGSKDADRADMLLETLNLKHLEDKSANTLSGGETARMCLARIMMRDFDLLILDEPAAAMDMESAMLAEKAISEYRSRTGCTVLLITHSLHQARRLADRVLYFEKGNLVEQGPVIATMDQPQTESFRAFLDF